MDDGGDGVGGQEDGWLLAGVARVGTSAGAVVSWIVWRVDILWFSSCGIGL